MYQSQNALQRLLAVMLDEHCSLIGLVGPHSLLLFGSEIVTCEIATASTSTKPQSSRSSLLQPDLPGNFSELSLSLKEAWALLLSFGSSLAVAVTSWEGGVWLFNFGLIDSVLNVRSV